MARNMETIITTMIGGFVMQNAQLQSLVEALQEKCVQLETDLAAAKYKGPVAVPTPAKEWLTAPQLELPLEPV